MENSEPKRKTNWWFQLNPFEKIICLSNWILFSGRGEHTQNKLKPPPRQMEIDFFYTWNNQNSTSTVSRTLIYHNYEAPESQYQQIMGLGTWISDFKIWLFGSLYLLLNFTRVVYTWTKSNMFQVFLACISFGTVFWSVYRIVVCFIGLLYIYIYMCGSYECHRN